MKTERSADPNTGVPPRWSLVALGLPIWISMTTVSTLTRDLGVTLGAGESGATNATVLRLLLSAALALPVSILLAQRSRWTGMAVTATAWSLAAMASAAIVPDPGGFTMAWALAGVSDVMGFVALGLLTTAVLGPDKDRRVGAGALAALLLTSVAGGAVVTAVGEPWLSLNWRGVLVAMIGLVLPAAFAASTVRCDIDVRALEVARKTPALSLGELCAAAVASASRRRGLTSVGLFGALMFAWMAFGPSLLRSRWLLSVRDASLALAAGFAVGAGAAWLRVVREWKKAVLVASIVGPLLFCGALAAPQQKLLVVGLVVASMAAIGFALAGAIGSVVTTSSDETQPTVYALAYIAFAAGGAGGVLVASTVDRRFGTAIALSVSAIPALLAALTNWLVPTELERAPSSPSTSPSPSTLPSLSPVDLGASSVDRGSTLPPLVELRNIDVFYGQVQVLFGVNLAIRHDEIVALLGTNGAGKSTALKVIAGQILPRSGAVLLEGTNITSLSAERRVPLGLAQIPGGRAVFGSLSVVENLELFAASLGNDRVAVKRGIDRTFATFPRLEAHRNRDAETLSGGEQQMLALGKALLLEPRLLCIDELSLGLAPTVVADLLDLVRTIHANGTTIVIVEQSVNVALSIAQRAIFMEKGEVRFDGDAAELRDRSDLLRSVFLHGAATT